MNSNFSGQHESTDKASRKRQTQSCDRCKFKKRKCDGLQPCGNCVKSDAECTMLIEQKKRGPKRAGVESGNEGEKRIKNESVVRSVQQGNDAFQQVSFPIMTQMDGNLASDPQLQTFNESLNLNGFGADMPLDYQYDQNPMRVLDFDSDFALNFGLDSFNNFPTVDIPLDQMKPSAYNPSLFNTASQPLSIDPEVLNLYTQLNPKLTIQNDLDLFLSSTLGSNIIPKDDSFLYGATNLTIPELPGMPTTFYMHLISMFFTYYHPSMPIMQESIFLENLVPANRHHPMLLNTIYAIGCHYSRSPYLYQSPFYTPQKAVDYFIARALAATPAPESWGLITSNSIAISQASLLLSSCDFQLKKSHTWMMIGMAIRLNQKFEMQSEKASHNFMSIFNGINKFHVDCTTEERKRVWWGSMLSDLFLSLSTGSCLLINEAEFVGTLTSTEASHMSNRPVPIEQTEINPIVTQGQTRISSQGNSDSDKWMPYFSGFPKDTIFGASDVNSELWGRQSLGFFQVGHLFSNLNDMLHVMQLSFLTRRAIRHVSSASVPSGQISLSASYLYSLLPTIPGELTRIHDSLVLWYENLPAEFRLWRSLGVLVSEDFADMTTYCTLKDGKRLSSVAVLLNLLFFATLSILHQRNAAADSLQESLQPNQKFRITSSPACKGLFESKEMLKLAYRGQVYLLRRVYGQYFPPQPTTIPPSEIVGSSLIGCLLMPTATALLGQEVYAGKLLEKFQANVFVPIHEQQDATGIDPLESVFLPVLENIGQVWPAAHTFAATLRSIMLGVGTKIDRSAPINQMWQQFVNGSQKNDSPVFTSLVGSPGLSGSGSSVLPQGLGQNSNELLSTFGTDPSIQDKSTSEKTWHELRSEFEDEFLL